MLLVIFFLIVYIPDLFVVESIETSLKPNLGILLTMFGLSSIKPESWTLCWYIILHDASFPFTFKKRHMCRDHDTVPRSRQAYTWIAIFVNDSGICGQTRGSNQSFAGKATCCHLHSKDSFQLHHAALFFRDLKRHIRYLGFRTSDRNRKATSSAWWIGDTHARRVPPNVRTNIENRWSSGMRSDSCHVQHVAPTAEFCQAWKTLNIILLHWCDSCSSLTFCSHERRRCAAHLFDFSSCSSS
jgi:hypothetical protein